MLEKEEESITNDIHTEFEEENRWRKDPIKVARVKTNTKVLAEYFTYLFEKYGKDIPEEDDDKRIISMPLQNVTHSGHSLTM